MSDWQKLGPLIRHAPYDGKKFEAELEDGKIQDPRAYSIRYRAMIKAEVVKVENEK